MAEAAIPNNVTSTILWQIEAQLSRKSNEHQPTQALELVRRFAALLVGQSSESLADILHPHVVLEIYGPPDMIWTGRAAGISDVTARLRSNFEAAELQETRLLDVHTSATTAMLVLQESGRLKGGPGYSVHAVQVWSIADGKIIGIRELLDDPDQLRRPASS